MQDSQNPSSSKSRPFNLARHLPHLLRRAHFEADAIFAQVYGAAVTSRQLSLLVAVGMQPGASQSEVANIIGLDLNTCSDLVARTIGKGLLRRERSASDARSYCLYLTEEGVVARDEGITLAPRYQEMVAARLNAAERAQLSKLLRKMLGFD